jgi:hypothetical protein
MGAPFSRLREKVPGSAGRMRVCRVAASIRAASPHTLIRHAPHATFSRKREKGSRPMLLPMRARGDERLKGLSNF